MSTLERQTDNVRERHMHTHRGKMRCLWKRDRQTAIERVLEMVNREIGR